MADRFISSEVRDFILRHIDSVAQLEALLLLRAQTGDVGSAAELSKRLYIAVATAETLLARLVAANLCVHGAEGYRYSPGEADRALVDRVAETYARYLIPVTNLIHDKPSRIQQFADAFRFRKDK